MDIREFPIDGRFQFKIQNDAVNAASFACDSFTFAPVEPIDCGVVAGFPSLNEAVIEDLAGCGILRPIVLDIATALAGEANVHVAVGIGRAPLYEPLFDEMFHVATRPAGVAVVAVLNQVFSLDCSESPNIREGLHLGIPEIVGACPRRIGFSRFAISSRRSPLLVANLARARVTVRSSVASALAARIRRGFLAAGGFCRTANARIADFVRAFVAIVTGH